MCKNKLDLVYRGNVVFHIYRACLFGEIPFEYFIPIKHAVEKATKVDLQYALKTEKIMSKIEKEQTENFD